MRLVVVQDRPVRYRELKATMGICMRILHKVLSEHVSVKKICDHINEQVAYKGTRKPLNVEWHPIICLLEVFNEIKTPKKRNDIETSQYMGCFDFKINYVLSDFRRQKRLIHLEIMYWRYLNRNGTKTNLSVYKSVLNIV